MTRLTSHLAELRRTKLINCAAAGRKMRPSRPISRSTVVGWMSGKRIPDMATFYAFARATGISNAEILQAMRLAALDAGFELGGEEEDP